MFGSKKKIESWLPGSVRLFLDTITDAYEIHFISARGVVDYREAFASDFTNFDVESIRVTHKATQFHHETRLSGGFRIYDGMDFEATDFIASVNALVEKCSSIPVTSQERVAMDICNYFGQSDENVPAMVKEDRIVEFHATSLDDGLLEKVMLLISAARTKDGKGIPIGISINLVDATDEQLRSLSDAIVMAGAAAKA